MTRTGPPRRQGSGSAVDAGGAYSICGQVMPRKTKDAPGRVTPKGGPAKRGRVRGRERRTLDEQRALHRPIPAEMRSSPRWYPVLHPGPLRHRRWSASCSTTWASCPAGPATCTCSSASASSWPGSSPPPAGTDRQLARLSPGRSSPPASRAAIGRPSRAIRRPAAWQPSGGTVNRRGRKLQPVWLSPELSTHWG